MQERIFHFKLGQNILDHIILSMRVSPLRRNPMKLRILLYKYINQTLNKVKISESVDLRGKSLYIREKTVVYVRQVPVMYIREQTVYMHPT